MIEADVTIEIGFIAMILDVMDSKGHLKSLVTGSLLMWRTSISLTKQ